MHNNKAGDEMVCGIYRIVNRVNGKSYVGQSRNISKRWRQHTARLEKSEALEHGTYPLRAAFLKYGLEQFEFKIIEECVEADLLSRENHWIDQLKPEYNCNIWTPARKRKVEKSEPKFWLQYHNCDRLGYFPAELSLDELNDEELEDGLPGISTAKRSILGAKGDTVFLIVGFGDRTKQYYLVSRFIIEEIEIDEESERPYDAFGDGWLVNPPQLLNSAEFDDFKKHCGNFGFGFMSVDKTSYLETLDKLSVKYGSKNVNFSRYVEQFYRSLADLNPDELPPLTNRGAMRHLAISFYPDDAVLVLQGINTKLIVFGATDLLVRYKDRLLIHTLSFYEDIDSNFRVQLTENCLTILESFGLDQDIFPAHAIQGCVAVDNVFKYDSESFAADKDAHGKGEDLDSYRLECGFSECDAWCIEVSQPVLFKKPILLSEPEGIQEGDPWFPGSELEVKAFRLALKYTAREG